MTRGIRLKLFGRFFLLGLFAYVGVLACGVGIIATALIAGQAACSIYLDLSRGSQVQTATVVPAPGIPANPA